MTDRRPDDPAETAAPVPRDMPDQQVTEGEDPWDVSPTRAAGEQETEPGQDTGDTGGSSGSGDAGESGTDVPDTDEAGTGRRGASRGASGDPDQPVPDESPA
ncbi:hypothetical protein [Streptomyces griseosporeus]|uniref:hypothetical protein n=1 Tax=Streptomyces griseosporeus TaxID=1910 RepID=UPI0036FF6502